MVIKSKTLHLQIALKYTDPVIWRIVTVPDGITLEQLHYVIQFAMGWDYSHLYEFDINGERYAGQDPWSSNADSGVLNKKLINVLGSKKKFHYMYDFGDSWLHELTVKKSVSVDKAQNHALCLEGENNCPPEDIGGVPGFEWFVEVMANPEHGDYNEMLDWYGERFDSERFDIDAINKRLKAIKL
ncbi:plasmid pRiA4b ORF-3 family protein [Porticoccus sp. GXU_MW_L64]